jgi:phosphoglycolate phosphatase
MLRHGFPQLDDAGHEALRERYLQLYTQRLSLSTRLFPGLAELLKSLEQAGLAWGIVTNKPAYLTEPLLSALELAGRCACIVSGDTLPRRKPHPDPLLHAARLAGVPAEAAMYIGDARRDIEAGQAAGMTTVAAIYGYIDPAEDPAAWGADYTVTEPGELQPLLRRAGWLPEI